VRKRDAETRRAVSGAVGSGRGLSYRLLESESREHRPAWCGRPSVRFSAFCAVAVLCHATLSRSSCCVGILPVVCVLSKLYTCYHDCSRSSAYVHFSLLYNTGSVDTPVLYLARGMSWYDS
jgi:hypothetical protein